MIYKNKRTGAIVDSSFKITGKDWEEVKPKAKPRSQKATSKKVEE